MEKISVINPAKALIPLYLLMLVAMSGCAQKDSSVGSGLAAGLNNIYPQEVYVEPDTSRFYHVPVTTLSSSYLYLGHDQGYDAGILLRFYPNTVLPDSFTVDSAVVSLCVDIVVSSLSSELNAPVFYVGRGQVWYTSAVTWNTFNVTDNGSPMTALTVPGTATDSTFLSFSLPEADSLVRAWYIVGENLKTLDFNNGIYLGADPTSNLLVRFNSANSGTTARRPKLRLYLTQYDTAGIGSPLDTVVYASSDAFITKDFGTLPEENLYLGGGDAYRSLLLYNVEGLFPTYYGIAVQRAEIILHTITDSPYNLDKISGGYAMGLEDSTWIQYPDSAAILSGYPSVTAYDSTSSRLVINVTDLAYDWIRYPGTNQGILISCTDEGTTLCRTAFYGLNAPDSLRPRLRLVYLENVE
jgi:hypothetical protein